MEVHKIVETNNQQKPDEAYMDKFDSPDCPPEVMEKEFKAQVITSEGIELPESCIGWITKSGNRKELKILLKNILQKGQTDEFSLVLGEILA